MFRILFSLIFFLLSLSQVYQARAEMTVEQCSKKTKALIADNHFLLEKVGYDKIDRAIQKGKDVILGRQHTLKNIKSRFIVHRYVVSNGPEGDSHTHLRKFESSNAIVLLHTKFRLDRNHKLSLTTSLEFYEIGSSYPLFSLSKSHSFDSNCLYQNKNIEYVEFIFDKEDDRGLQVIKTNIDLLSHYLTNTEDIVNTSQQGFKNIPHDSLYMSTDLSFLKHIEDNNLSSIQLFTGKNGIIKYSISEPAPYNYILTQVKPNKDPTTLETRCTGNDFFHCEKTLTILSSNDSDFKLVISSSEMSKSDWINKQLFNLSNFPPPSTGAFSPINGGRVTIRTSSHLVLHNQNQYWNSIQSSESSIAFSMHSKALNIVSVPLSEKAPPRYSSYLSSSEFIDPNHPTILEWKKKHFNDYTGSRRDALKKISDFINDNFIYDDILAEYELLNYKSTSLTFSRKKGICTDFSNIFVAMARSIGIPARIITGYMFEQGGDINFNFGHAWVEVNLDNETWTPLEPQGGHFIKELSDLYIPFRVLVPSSSLDDLVHSFNDQKKVKKILSIITHP